MKAKTPTVEANQANMLEAGLEADLEAVVDCRKHGAAQEWSLIPDPRPIPLGAIAQWQFQQRFGQWRSPEGTRGDRNNS